jgi:hypothetical protein
MKYMNEIPHFARQLFHDTFFVRHEISGIQSLLHFAKRAYKVPSNMPFPERVSLGSSYSMFQTHQKAIRDITKGLSFEEGLFFKQKQLDLKLPLVE